MSHLLEPLKIKSLDLKNRLVMPPMASAKCQDGFITQSLLDYYKEKSEGGYISLIIVEHNYISKEGQASKNQASIADDSNDEKLKELAEIIHRNGSKAVVQINHAGIQADEIITALTVVGPSAILNEKTKIISRELTVLEIKDIVKKFVDASRRVKKAGFDGVEIHSAHGYLLNQFFSPLTNKRNDEYGGDVYGRIRIHLEIIEEVRKAVGEDFSILLRIGASDYKDGGTTIEDSIIATKEFEKAGVDIIDVSGGFVGYKNPEDKGEGYFALLSEAIRNEVNIPVILTGGVVTREGAETMLSADKADLIGVGRAIFTNSNWAKETIEGLKQY